MAEIGDVLKEETTSVAEALTFENMYFALLGAAEDFRISKNPDIRKSIHCLEAILTLNPPARVEVSLFETEIIWLSDKILLVFSMLIKFGSVRFLDETPNLRFGLVSRLLS